MTITFFLLVPVEVDGCFLIDEHLIETTTPTNPNTNKITIFMDDDFNVVTPSFQVFGEQQIPLLASSCSLFSNSHSVLVDDNKGYCQPLDKSTCYPDISIKQVQNENAIEPTVQCDEIPCNNFTKAYLASDQIVWGTVTKIYGETAENGDHLVQIGAKCQMKYPIINDMRNGVFDIVISGLADLSQPVIEQRDYIFAVTIRKYVNGVPEFVVISPPVPGNSANWASLFHTCGLGILPYDQDASCIVDLPKQCHESNVSDMQCPGLSDSFDTRFKVSSLAIIAQLNSVRQPADEISKSKWRTVLLQSLEAETTTTGENQYRINVTPLCQLSGGDTDIGPLKTFDIKCIHFLNFC